MPYPGVRAYCLCIIVFFAHTKCYYWHMTRRRLGVFALILLTLGSTLASTLLAVAKVSALRSPPAGNVTTATFLDRAHISLTTSGSMSDGSDSSKATGVYFDNDISDAQHNLRQGGPKQVGVTNGCQSDITITNVKHGLMSDPNTLTATAQLHLKLPTSGTANVGAKCNDEGKFDITVADSKIVDQTVSLVWPGQGVNHNGDHTPGMTSDIIFFKPDANTVYTSDDDPVYTNNGGKIFVFRTQNGANGPFQVDGSAAYFNQGIGGFCPSFINNADNGSPTLANYYDAADFTGGSKTCNSDAFSHNKHYAVLLLGGRPDAGITTPTGTAGSGTNQDLCPIKNFALRWLACPIEDIADKFIVQTDALIDDLMTVDMKKTFDRSTSSGAAYYKAWDSFRLIAVSLLVVVALVMVVGQAMGLEVLDAYTIRKVLPRLLMATVFLTLSWSVMSFVVQFFNDLGNWIGDIVVYPFQNLGDVNKANAAQIVGQYILAGGAFAVLGILGVLSFLGTLALAILVAFIVLIIRKMIITLCILTSPVAIVAYILPNTQRLWKFWMDGFLPALVAFPIISLILASGKVFALISNVGSGSWNIVPPLAIIASYMGIGWGLKAAGGFISVVSGAVNDRHRGAFDRLRNYRSQQPAQRYQRLKSGEFFNDTLLTNANRRGPMGAIGRFGNTMGRRYGLGAKQRYGMGAGVGQEAFAQSMELSAREQLKNNPRLQVLAQTDDNGSAVLALSGGTVAGARAAAQQLADANGWEPDVMQRALSSAQATGITHENANAMFSEMMVNKARAIPGGRTDLIQDGADRLAEGNTTYREALMQRAAYAARAQGGRVDLGGTSTVGSVQATANRLMTSAPATTVGQQAAAGGGQPVGRAVTRQEALAHATMLDGMDRTDVRTIAMGHTAGMRQLAQTIEYLQTSDRAEDRETAARYAYELHQNLSSGVAPDANAKIIRDLVGGGRTDDEGRVQLRGLALDLSGGQGTPTVAQQLVERFNVPNLSANELSAGARAYGERSATPLGGRQGDFDQAA